MEDVYNDDDTAEGSRGASHEPVGSHKTPFRFKARGARARSDGTESTSHRGKRRKVDGRDGSQSREEERRSSRRHSERRGHRNRGHSSRGGSEPPNPTYEMDAELAFRESLFDALADDEGAAFWEGVYGQPIHTYPNAKPADEDDPESELRQMNDEEYTAFVRQQMWEKSHQHVIEERRRREEAAKRRGHERKRTSQMESEREAFNRRMEESLQKGEARRRDKAWREAWKVYVRGWEKLLSHAKDGTREPRHVEDEEESAKLIPWPTRSGRATDAVKGEVEAFFEHAAARDSSKDSLRAMLKAERVRWHPDKMQQRFGSDKIAPETLKAVVAVFQIVDAQFARL